MGETIVEALSLPARYYTNPDYYRTELDWFFLGIGTCLLGSCDRRFGPAAGMVGFKHPAAGPYRKLHTLRWHPRYARQGWIGGHLSQASPWFVSRTIADSIRQAEASAPPEDGSGLRANTHSSTG